MGGPEHRLSSTGAASVPRLLFDKSVVPCTLVTADGVFVDVNEAWLKLLGFTREEVLGRTSLDLGLVPDLGERRRIIETVRASGEVRDRELTMRTKSGSLVEVSVNSDLVNIDGRDHMLASFVDVTARKRAERVMASYTEELERTVAERTAELRARNEELEAFSFAVAHDLRAPLRGIGAFAELLERDVAGRLDERARADFEGIVTYSERVSRLIEALLALFRVTNRPLSVEPVDLSALALSIAAELRRTHAGRDVELVVEPGLSAEGDPELLRDLLHNLLDNAWKYSSRRPRARVELGRARDAAGDVFFVRDDGVGFDGGRADELFKPFHRLHASGEFPGTGIGLATARRIVSRHGGRIWAEGSPGKGAVFRFTLPARRSEPRRDVIS